MMKTRFALARPLRSLLAAALLPTTLTIAPLAIAGDKVVLLTSWYAQAEQGGFYQALADGLYEKEGLDVSIRMGGPQVNGMQLLVSKQADFIVNYDLQILKSVEQGLPVVAVAAPFQGDPQGLMTHADVSGLDALGGKPVLVSTSGQQTWWPWLKGKYQLADNQARPYTFNLQPFLADPQTTQQAYASSELFQAIKAGVTPNFFLFADAGYPPYESTVVTRQDIIAQHPERVAGFVRASMEGWKRYLDDPSAGNALIKRDNPNMTDELLAWGVSTLKQYRLVTGGEAATQGIGTMNDSRWQATRDFMVEAGLLGPDAPWRNAYTTRFVQDLKVLPEAEQVGSR